MNKRVKIEIHHFWSIENFFDDKLASVNSSNISYLEKKLCKIMGKLFKQYYKHYYDGIKNDNKYNLFYYKIIYDGRIICSKKFVNLSSMYEELQKKLMNIKLEYRME